MKPNNKISGVPKQEYMLNNGIGFPCIISDETSRRIAEDERITLPQSSPMPESKRKEIEKKIIDSLSPEHAEEMANRLHERDKMLGKADNESTKSTNYNSGNHKEDKHAHVYPDNVILITLPEVIRHWERIYTIKDTTLKKYKGAATKGLKHAVIPDGITEIGERAFENETDVVAIYLPETIKSISHGAFKGCKKLKYINIPESVESIGEDVFDGCTTLQALYIPNNVKKCHTLGKLKVKVLRLPLHLAERGVISSYSEVFQLVVGLPEHYDLEDINSLTYHLQESEITPIISFEPYKHSSRYFDGFSNAGGALIAAFSGEIEQEVWALNIPISTLAVPTGVEGLGSLCFGENRPTAIYIPESVNAIEEDTLVDGMVHKVPTLITKEANYRHLMSILPNVQIKIVLI